MTDLLAEAVNALTAPTIAKVAQVGDDGTWIRNHTVVHPPLLRQLADAVKPASAISGPGTPSLPSERSPIDLRMLYEYAKISGQIRAWCRMAKVEVTRPPHVDVVSDLDAWYAHRSASGMVDAWYIGQLRKWADLIRDLLQPGESFEADYPCPICGQSEWGDYLTGGSTRAILVTYRKDDSGHVSDERAVCRACAPVTVWEGHESLMELAEEQHEKRALEN